MTNALLSITLLPPSASDACKDLVTFGLHWGGRFIIASFVFAVLGTLLSIIVGAVKAWKGPTDPAKPRSDDTGWTKFLDALKGVLEALAALPAWIAIYLAGIALLWIAGHPASICP